MNDVIKELSFLSRPTLEQLLNNSEIAEFEAQTELLRENQFVKVLPVVLKGLVKVYTRFDDRELLLYYIQSAQSCVMSLSAVLNNEPSRIYAVTEEHSRVLLIPYHLVESLIKEFPDFNRMFYRQYDLRYSEMLDTIESILMNKMDHRLYEYLEKKWQLTGKEPMKLSHGQIANELGTVREVVSRIIKKLEIEGKLSQTKHGIVIIGQ